MFGLVGFFVLHTPMLVLVALFVWMSAAGEASAVTQEGMFADTPLSKVMITDVRTLAPTDALGHAVELLLAGFQQDFPVLEDGTRRRRADAPRPADARCASAGATPRSVRSCAATSPSPTRTRAWRTRSRACATATARRCPSCAAARCSAC